MHRSKVFAKFVWFLSVSFFVYQFILRLSPGALYEEIIVNYGIDATSFAVISGVYYLGYAGMQVPIGILLDKFGIKYIIAACAIICSLGNLTFIYTESWQLALVGRFFVGFGSAAGALASIKTVSIAFDKKDVSKMIGWSITLGLLGAINGKKINNLLIDNLDWNIAILALSLPGVIIAVLTFFICSNKLKLAEGQKETFDGSVFNALKQVATNKKILLISIFGALLVGPLEAFADIWGSPFFVNLYGFTRDEGGYLSASAMYFGMCFGSPLLAWVADKRSNHISLNMLSGIVMGLAFVVIMLKLTSNFYVLFAIVFIIGIFCAYQVIIFAKITDIVDTSVSGIAVSFVNMINMAAGFGFNYIFGFIVDLVSQGNKGEENMMHSSQAFEAAMLILPATLFLGAFGFYCYKKKFEDSKKIEESSIELDSLDEDGKSVRNI